MTIDFFAHAERELWADAELTPARVARLFDPLLKGGADWADIYFQSILSRDWLLEDGAVRTGSFVIDRGAGMRTVTGERQTLAYANALDWASLMRFWPRTRTARASARCLRRSTGSRAGWIRASPT